MPKHSSYIPHFLEFNDNVKLYHWSTISYTRHSISGSLYDEIQEFTDKFIETCIGHHGLSPVKSKLSLKSLSDKEFVKYVREFVNFARSINEPELSNQRDELLDILHRYLYLLRMD
jgi:hypothetical protein